MPITRIAQTEAHSENRDRVSDLLRRAIPDLELVQFSAGKELLEALRERAFDCILLNSHLPDMNGLTALRQIRLDRDQRHTPVVILADKDDSRTAVRAIKLGANEYLASQHADLDTLRQTVLAAMNAGEQARAQEQQQQQLKAQALTDPLTHLLNRRAFTARLERLTDLQTNQGKHFALIMIDLNQFKEVNDAFGHDAGDRVLTEMAERLRHITRGGDSVFRIGGDEFVVLIDNNPTPAAARGLAERLHDNLQAAVVHQDQAHYAGGGSIGVALYPRDGFTPQELVSAADEAMYAAKALGGGVCVFGDRDP